ncbi:polysaccharide pyruvyl transferase family protein [Spirosoma koreense]
MPSRRDFIKVSTLSPALSFGVNHPELAFAASLAEQPKNNPVIILRSSWGDGNIGDQGHTPGTIRLLSQYLPDAEILLWHVDPRPETEKLISKNFPAVKVIRGKFFEAGKPFDGELKSAFDRADMFIFNSGMAMNFGLFGKDWAANMSSLTPFVYCAENRIPFGIYGQSFDRFDFPSMYVYRNVLSQAAFVYCRDGESVKFLKENAFRTPVLEFGPDGCFGINVRNEEKGRAYLKKVGLEDQKFLTVVILTNKPFSAGKYDPLSLAQPAAIQDEQDQTRMAKVREMITSWVRETGLNVLLAPEVTKEIGSAKRYVYDLLPTDIQGKVVWRDTFWNADEAMSVYARAHTIFGMEPHSLIMGLTLGVPILHAWPPSHGRKAWMFRDIGLPEWLFQVDESTAADWSKQLRLIHQDYAGARKKVATAMAFVKNRQAATMQVIKRAIASRKV